MSANVKNITGPDGNGNYRAWLTDETVITFGPSDSHKGCWFVSVPEGNNYSNHTTFIVEGKDGTPFDQAGEWIIRAIKARGADKSYWRLYAVAIFNSR